jgi:hypothetical protein
MATLTSLCAPNLLQGNQLSPHNPSSTSKPLVRKHRCHYGRRSRLVVLAITKGSAKSGKSDEKIPSWARPDSDEPPPWARDGVKGSSEPTVQIPYVAYLLASAVTSIAAVNFIFFFQLKLIPFAVLVKYHGLSTLVLFLRVSLGYSANPFLFLVYWVYLILTNILC